MRFLEDERLYTNTEECLRFLRRLEPGPPAAAGAERYHMYWRGAFSRKPALSLKSFLATQDLRRSEVWLWLDGEVGFAGHEHNRHLRTLLDLVQVRRFDPETEARDTPLAGRPDLYHGLKARHASNFARYAALYKHGGTYVDLDLLFLRDLGGLARVPGIEDEFCYRWSAHMPYGNNACLRLRQGSAAARAILERCLARESCRSKDVLDFEIGAELDLLVLPCPFFDPLWPHIDHVTPYPEAPFDWFEGFFRPFDRRFHRRPEIQSLRDFFPGAFAYHWHNYWDAPEARNSYFGLFEAEVDDRLRTRSLST